MAGSKKVAVIGAGPSGIACARYLLLHGAEVTVFERHVDIGGQWDCSSPYSAVWPSMHSNTCSLTTRFSDMEYPADVSMFPENTSIFSYLKQYAQQFGVLDATELGTEVLQVEPASVDEHGRGNWLLTWRSRHDREERSYFDTVVVATGRCSIPAMPDISGLASFSGTGGVIHSSRYSGKEDFEGKRVVVVGGSTSGCEVASDIAKLETTVVSSVRNSRYVFQKIMCGRPAEYINLTRYGALHSELNSLEQDLDEFKTFITSRCGSPEQYGGIKPSENIADAGATMSQEYLLFIAEDRIRQKPRIKHVAGQKIYFVDGTSEENVDALVFCTGFNLDVPFLSESIREVLQPQKHHIPLAWYTLHPQLPELYFTGFGLPNGSMFLVAEQQARFIAYQCCGVVPPVSEAAVERALKEYMATPMLHGMLQINRLTIQHARLCGFEADISAYPELARYLLFGPLTPASFRLTGIDALPDAPARIVREAGTFEQMTSPVLTSTERELLKELAARKNSTAFTALVHNILRVQKTVRGRDVWA